MPLIPWIRPSSRRAWPRRGPRIGRSSTPRSRTTPCGTASPAAPASRRARCMIEHVDKIVGLRRNLVLEESRFPDELATSFNNMERYQNIWGQPASSRLDWAKGLPFEVPTAAQVGRGRRRGCRRRTRMPVLGRLRGVIRRPQPAGRPGGGDMSRSGRRQVRGARPGESRAPATRRGGWATSTSSRCSRWAMSRRSTATSQRRSSRPARTASTRSATSTASWAATTTSSTTRSSCRSWWGRAGCASDTPQRAGHALTFTTRATWRATTA